MAKRVPGGASWAYLLKARSSHLRVVSRARRICSRGEVDSIRWSRGIMTSTPISASISTTDSGEKNMELPSRGERK